MKRFILVAAIFLTTLPASMFAKDAIEVGQSAPEISATTDSGETISLADLYAKGPTLIYFYPKADTPGCTKQACNLRDNYEELVDAGVQVVGVSIDSVKSQAAFKEKYNLPFTLIADEDNSLGKAFGVGSFLGIAYKRQSFLVIDGKIAWRDLSATPATQTADALAALEASKK